MRVGASSAGGSGRQSTPADAVRRSSRRASGRARDLADAREHGLVSAMDAVEIADGQGAGRALSGRGRDRWMRSVGFTDESLQFWIQDQSAPRAFLRQRVADRSPTRRRSWVKWPAGQCAPGAARGFLGNRYLAGFFSYQAPPGHPDLGARQQRWSGLSRPGLAGRVVAVIASRPDAAGLDWARAQGIAASALHHKEYASRGPSTPRWPRKSTAMRRTTSSWPASCAC